MNTFYKNAEHYLDSEQDRHGILKSDILSSNNIVVPWEMHSYYSRLVEYNSWLK